MVVFLRNYWKKLSILLLILLLIMLVYVGFLYKPRYQVSTTLILGACESECVSDGYSMITMNDKLLPNYIQLAKNSDVLMDVKTKLNLDYSISKIESMIKVVSKNETQMFEIMVTSFKKGESIKIINELTDILVFKVKEVYKMDNLRVLDVSEWDTIINPVENIYIIMLVIVLLIVVIISFHYIDIFRKRKVDNILDGKKELTLEEVKEVSFEILKYIKKVCDENSLKYYLYCGTLLGAVKYKGFIPWDDDIDVVLLREDYMKLMDILCKRNDRYKLISIYNHKGCYYQFAKVVDSETILTEEAKPIEGMGVYVDIIPIDGCPDKNIDKFMKKIKILRKFATARWCSNNSRENRFSFKGQSNKSDKKLRYSYIKASVFNIITMPLGLRFFAKKLDRLASKYSYGDTKNVCRLLNGYGKREVIERKEFDKIKNYMFEGERFTSIKNSDIILNKLYGDYKNDPPVEEQKSHHSMVAYWKK